MDQAQLLLCSMWYRVCLPLYLFRSLPVQPIPTAFSHSWSWRFKIWDLLAIQSSFLISLCDDSSLSPLSDCYVFPGITFVCRSQHWTIRFKSLEGNSCGCPEIFFIFFTEVRLPALPHSVSYYPSVANMIDSPCDHFWLLGDFVLSTEGS